MYQLVLLRHGESTRNRENRYLGDPDAVALAAQAVAAQGMRKG